MIIIEMRIRIPYQGLYSDVYGNMHKSKNSNNISG